MIYVYYYNRLSYIYNHIMKYPTLNLMLSFFIILILISHQSVSQQIQPNTIHNPGILLQIPTNYTLPYVAPSLPQQIPSILAQKLQLSNIMLRNIQYKWRYQNDKFVILLQTTLITFDWVYGKDQGKGSFIQQYSDLIVVCSYGINNSSRFTVDIQSAKITNQDKRHSIKVHLGGNVRQTLVIQVTNLILNHAKIAFRLAIKAAVSKVVQALTQPLRQDPKLMCVNTTANNNSISNNKQQCIYLNTSLVAKPTVYPSQKIQLIQINGAAYIDKNHSDYLDSSEAMFKISNSTLMNVQICKQFFNRIIQLYLKISPITKAVNTMEISDILDIDSQTLSILFPGMRNYIDPRPVIVDVSISQATIQLDKPPYMGVKASATLKVQTLTTSLQPYISKAAGILSIYASPVINGHLASVRINKISIDALDFSTKDIQSGLVDPPQLTRHLPAFLEWAAEAANGQLNNKKQSLEFAGVGVQPKVTVLTNSNSINVEIRLKQVKKINISQKYNTQHEKYADGEIKEEIL